MDFPGPGIYPDVPEEDYHSVPALSQSGIKHLLVSPLDFWARSWMNPRKTKEQETESLALGKMYHARILEGKDAFYDRYCRKPSIDDHPDKELLTVTAHFREWLSMRGLKVSGTKRELIDRCIENGLDPDMVWDDYEKKVSNGRIPVDPRVIDDIEFAAALIEKHPEIGKCFTNGHPEVSVFWVDQDTGVPMKARIDYLKQHAIVDLKSFSNYRGSPVDKQILRSFASYKYHIQAAMYLRGIKVFDQRWRKFIFVFQQIGPAPLAKGKVLEEGIMLGLGDNSIDVAAQKFRRLQDAWGSEPWLFDPEDGAEADIQPFFEAEIPDYVTEL